MKVTCDTCQATFDDALCSTVCPHDGLMSTEDMQRKILALDLIGKAVRFRHQREIGPDLHVQSVSFNGYVTLAEGPGEYAPHLFVVMP
jgi:hypothetical protein